MNLFRLNEHYTSIQGEGPNVGRLTQFVRFSGCNLRCPGWPCDTPHAIFPHLWIHDPKVRAEDLATDILAEAEVAGARHVCLTGGEPLMQPKDVLRLLFMELNARCTFDVFTNGTQQFPRWLLSNPAITIVMDWKLTGAGEPLDKFSMREYNVLALRPHDAIKFVVKDEADLYEARHITFDGMDNGVRARFYVGAVWGQIDDDVIVEYIKKHKLPWILNVQVHKHIWGEKRGV